MSISKRRDVTTHMERGDYYRNLSLADASNVQVVVNIINGLASDYEKQLFCSDAVFGVYGIGGYVNKEGQRPDVDLLIFDSAEWPHGYYSPLDLEGESFDMAAQGNHVIGSVADYFGNNGFGVTIPKEIPDEYRRFGADPKVMVKFTPNTLGMGSPIDVVHVKGAYGDPPIRTFEDFYSYDIDDIGSPLGRVSLLEAEVTVLPAQWRP